MRRLSVIILFLICLSPYKVHSQEEIWDPIEPVNRGIFWFNDKMDVYAAEPVSRGYDKLVPRPLQKGISNFFDNLSFPREFLSALLQLKFKQAFRRTGRFILNTTVGWGGLFDVGADLGLADDSEDFGLVFADWGLPAGPYIVLPILGPSNLRDTIGWVFDGFTDPVNWAATLFSDPGAGTGVILGMHTLHFIDTRAGLLEAVESGKEASLDYYLFLQSAYYQHRKALLNDGEIDPFED